MSRFFISLLILFITLTSIFLTYAETSLSGEVKIDILTDAGNPYIVQDNIVIPKGQQCIIKSGCNLLFKPFTGLQVYGTLIVEGTQENPVFFTSFNDSSFNKSSTVLANTFDWNGIEIFNSSNGTSIGYLNLYFSVYGINSQTPMVGITHCIFAHNGDNVKINGVPQLTVPLVPFTYNFELSNGEHPPKQKPSFKEIVVNQKKTIRFSSLVTGVISIITGTVFIAISSRERNELANIRIGKINVETGKEYTPSDYSAVLDDYHQKRTGSIVCFSLGAACIGIFAFTFKF